VAAAGAAVAAKPNKSRIIYMTTGHRALGFGEIAVSYGETIVRQVRYRFCSIDKYLTWGRRVSTILALCPFRERHRPDTHP
jgi:uncharacterized protein YbjT (DUF2867 family)